MFGKQEGGGVLALLIFNTVFFSPVFLGEGNEALAQSGQKWASGLNSASGSDALGTSNNFPLVIKTNGTERLRVKETGELLLNYVAGYAADYSTLFTATSLVDKQYVDNAIANIVFPPIPPSLWSAGTGQYSIMNNLPGSNSSQAQYSFIASGNNNSIYSNAQYGIILGGTGNQIQNVAPAPAPAPTHNLIGSGTSNTIQHNANYSAILNGRNNIMDDHFSLILNGENNVIEAPTVQSSYNMISNGVNNRIRSNANFSSIIGGFNNTIASGVVGAVILGGNNITATQPNAVYVTRIAFPDGTIQTTAAGASPFSAGTGQNSLMNNLTGSNNAQAVSSFIASGSNNFVALNAHNGVILGGIGNQIRNFVGFSPVYNIIGTGTNNIIEHTANNSAILSGQNNIVADEFSVILSGSSNIIQAPVPSSPDSYNLITSGNNNSILSTAHHSSIIGGNTNTIASGVFGTVILGGQNITATQSNTVYMSNLAVTSLTGTGDRALGVDANGNFKVLEFTDQSATAWNRNGNTGTNASADFLGTTDQQDLVFKTNSEEHMRISATGDHPGNVGIGTDDPEKKLHVVTKHTTCVNCTPQTHEGIRLEEQTIYTDAQSPPPSIWDLQPFGAGFAIKTPTGIPKFLIAETGNVGIGTTNPLAKLEVIGTGKFTGDVSLMGNTIVAGNVGIGIPNPVEKLEVAGTIKATGLAITGTMQASAYASFSPLKFEAPVGTERARIDDITGNFGIGTPTPISKLDILNGNINVEGDPSAAWTDAHWRVILTSQLGSIWRTTNPNSFGHYLGFGMTSNGPTSGWYWGTSSALDASLPPSYPMKLESNNSGFWTLQVCGKVRVTATGCDFVFADSYKKMPWQERELYYKTYKRLPFMDSASEMESNGLDIAKNFSGLLQNVEETALSVTELYKLISMQQEQINNLQKENIEMKKGIESLIKK